MNPESRGTVPNTRPPTVRNAAGRSARSRGALHTALTSLMHEKPFDTITVSELVQRARIGRTTFYAHFQDQGDLLLTAFSGMLSSMTGRLAADPGSSGRLLPVREFFEHVASAKQVLAMLADSDQLGVLWRLAALHFAKSIESRVGGSMTARCAAGAMIETLHWWLEQRDPPSPAEVDRDFHAFLFGRLRSSGGSFAR